jgi:Ca2+-binding EF-hand superfamily protein
MKGIFVPLSIIVLLGAPAAFGAPAPDAPLTIDTSHSADAPRERLFLSPSGEPFRPQPGAPEPFEAWFAQADANHDGVIDRAEFRADATRFFKRVDTNGDGMIDGFEVAAYERNIVPELGDEAEGRFPADPGEAHAQDGDHDHGGGDGGHHGGRDGGKGGHGAPGPRGLTQLLDEPEPVSGADFELDGHITFAEWMRATDQRFDLLDTAKTGRLTHDQLKALLLKPLKTGR